MNTLSHHGTTFFIEDECTLLSWHNPKFPSPHIGYEMPIKDYTYKYAGIKELNSREYNIWVKI